MPRPTNTARVVVAGLYPSGEEFNWGFWLSGAPASNADAGAAALVVRDYIQGLGGDPLRAYLAPDCSYDKVTVYGYGSGIGPADFQGEAVFTERDGISAGASLPLQCAVVVSLRTGRPGRRGRGRMYVPVTASTLTDHQLAAGNAASLSAAIGGFFTNLNDSTLIPGSVCVLSQVDVEAHLVTSVIVDSRVDIQRRRADSQMATQTASALVEA